MQDENWDDLRVLLAVARAGSFVGAARDLSADETTVARRISRLERRRGAPLIERSGGRISLTPDGRNAADAAEAMEQARLRLSNGAAATGDVRLTAAAILINRALAPRLPHFVEAHPGVTLHLLADAADYSLIDREADVALRLARPRKDGRAVAKRLADLEYRAYRAPGGDGRWICYGESMAHVPQYAWTRERIETEGAAALTVNDAETLIACLKAGRGVGYLPAFAGDAIDGLARVDAPPRSRELWVTLHPMFRELDRIRAVADWCERVAKTL
ncbi:MAG: LysR family transcriptional regulator [Pseudomonadota bacterium]